MKSFKKIVFASAFGLLTFTASAQEVKKETAPEDLKKVELKNPQPVERKSSNQSNPSQTRPVKKERTEKPVKDIKAN